MGRVASFVSFASLFATVAMLLATVGQPLFTDDTWWHLAHGGAYAEQGPRLDGDPLLYTAPGPPAPAAWLADVALHFTHRAGGFPALRVGHALWVAGTLALLFALVARASRSQVTAALGTMMFVALATYRLVQLRPHLFTIFAALLLYALLFSGNRTPSLRRVACSVLLLGVWANVHAAFVLGPAIIAFGLGGIIVGELLKPHAQREIASPRVRRVALTLALGTAATLVNPSGIEPHFAYLIAGDETPSLTRVGDEWASIDLLALPALGEIPNPLDWILIWTLLLCTGAVVARGVSNWRRAGAPPQGEIDFVTLALSVLSFVAMLFATRFLWLSIFPLLFIAHAIGSRRDPGAELMVSARTTFAVATVVSTVAFGSIGDWPSVSRGLPRNLDDYARHYPAEKYHAHTVWFLGDAGLRGNLFAEYYLGGFLGYWLAPDVKTFVNGSLNVTRDAIDSNLPIRERRGARPGETFLELLDRQQVDLFLGIRLPRQGSGSRPWFHTTAHLEGEPGWIAIFRNLTSAVYLRDTQTNRDNLDRVADYYRSQGIAFDEKRGFEPAMVIDGQTQWAIAHGLVPNYFEKIIDSVNDRSSPKRARSLNMLAEIYTALGVYERAIAINRELLRIQPGAMSAHRRLAWSLLRSNDFAEARVAAEALRAHAPTDALSRSIIGVALQASEPGPELATAIARLPVFTRAEALRLRSGMVRPEARTR